MAWTVTLWNILLVFAITSLCLVQARILFQGATIATWNDTRETVEVYRDASLLVEGDEISRIYKSTDSIDKNGAETIDASNKIIVPGFISTHHHVWQTLYRTLIPNLPFAAYFPRLGHTASISSTLSVDDVYRSELMGALELLNEGTTTWVDITAVLSPETVEAAWKATFASGGSSFFGATVQDREDFSEDAQISQIKELSAQPELRDQSLVTLGLSYDGFDGATSTSRTKILDLVHSGDVDIITTHYVGGPFGSYNSPELLNQPEWSILNSSLPILFSHASHITPQDAYLLRETNKYTSIAPESEQHFGHGNPHSHLI